MKSRFLKSRLVAVVAVLAVLAVTATAIAATGTPSQVKTRKTSIGTILVDAKGKTLYLFQKDKRAKSSCYASCAANWPPYLTTAKPKAGPGAKQSLLGTTKRTNGKLQVTYNKHPLYQFVKDTAAGQVQGENLNAYGGEWYVVSAKGAKVGPGEHATSTSGSGAPAPTPTYTDTTNLPGY